MGFLIGPDNAGESQFRMVEPGYDPIEPPPERIVFDGRFAASRIIYDPIINLSERTGNALGSGVFNFPDLGFVPACRFFVYRNPGGFGYFSQNGGLVNSDLNSPIRFYWTESVFISNGLLISRVERSADATVTSSRVTVRNYFLGSGYRAKIFLFAT